MGKVMVIRKEAGTASAVGGGGGSVGVGLGGGGLMFMLGQGRTMTPEQLADAGFGEIGSDRHNRALRMQRIGHVARYGAAGLGAFNALYNQTSSGQPGIGGAMATGAMSGYAGTAGAEDIAARMGQRFGRKLDDKVYHDDFVEGPEVASPSPEPLMITEGYAEMTPEEASWQYMQNVHAGAAEDFPETEEERLNRDARSYDWS